jgi:Ca2+-binding EF-hand superfamily protein
MRSTRAIGLGLALLAGGVNIAPAQNAGGINFGELFQQLDANGDMVIDRGEVPESGRAAFDQLLKNADINKDGKIDREEYRDMLLSLRESFGSISGRFAEIDKNGDGKISMEEFNGPEAIFARIDANGDGAITKDEASKFQPGLGTGAGMFAQRILGMDRNGDGKVSREEFTGQPANFDRFDTNKDGFISRDELPGVAGAGNATPATAPFPAMLRERLQGMDKNSDGKIGKDEFTGDPSLFDRLDTNKDGSISPDELPQARPGSDKANGESGPDASNKG